MLKDTPDEPLALAAAGGDRAAFATLVHRHYARIHSLAWRLSGSKADAEDLTQEICASLPGRLRAFKGEARFTTWLYRVVVNANHDYRRRMAAYSKATGHWGEWELDRRAQAAQEEAQLHWLSEAMSALTPELRDTAALLLGEDLTQSEAAEILGLSEGTIAWRMSQIKKRLKAIAAKEAAR